MFRLNLQVLLARARLALARGHRYAVVGQNGVGKTTLMDRIGARDIEGFPKGVVVAYVRHEVLCDDPTLTCSAFMLLEARVSFLFFLPEYVPVPCNDVSEP